jgi:hypothetical protein
LRLKRVPFLSRKSFFALGGIPTQNSSTFTQKIRAALKCPSSCTITIMVNRSIATMIQNIIMIILYSLDKDIKETLKKYIFYYLPLFFFPMGSSPARGRLGGGLGNYPKPQWRGIG